MGCQLHILAQEWWPSAESLGPAGATQRGLSPRAGKVWSYEMRKEPTRGVEVKLGGMAEGRAAGPGETAFQ